MIFKFKTTEQVPAGSNAQEVGEWLERIGEKLGVPPTSQELLDEAKGDAPFSVDVWFEWDTELAAENWNRKRAADMASSVVQVRVVGGRTKAEVPAFVSLVVEGERRWHPSQVIIEAQGDQLRRLLQEVQDELRGLHERELLWLALLGQAIP